MLRCHLEENPVGPLAAVLRPSVMTARVKGSPSQHSGWASIIVTFHLPRTSIVGPVLQIKVKFQRPRSLARASRLHLEEKKLQSMMRVPLDYGALSYLQ